MHKKMFLCGIASVAVLLATAASPAEARSSDSGCGWSSSTPKPEAALYVSLNDFGSYVSSFSPNFKPKPKYFSRHLLDGFVIKTPPNLSSWHVCILDFKLIESKKVHGRHYYVFRTNWDVSWYWHKTGDFAADISQSGLPLMSIYNRVLYYGRYFR